MTLALYIGLRYKSTKMTKRYVRFRPGLKQQVQRNIASLRAQGIEPPESLLAIAEEYMPAKRQQRKPLSRADSVHKEPLERDILKAVIQVLRYHPRVIKVLRMNSGGAMYRDRQGHDSLVLFSSEPVPDIHVLLRTPPQIGWIEIKRPSFKAPRDAREERQARFLEDVRKAGGIGAFVRSVEEALDAIK